MLTSQPVCPPEGVVVEEEGRHVAARHPPHLCRGWAAGAVGWHQVGWHQAPMSTCLMRGGGAAHQAGLANQRGRPYTLPAFRGHPPTPSASCRQGRKLPLGLSK